MSKKQNQKGFTIVELLIATSIFTTIVLLVTVGIVTMGRRYYKGLTTVRTQEAARSIESDISQMIQVSGNATLNDYSVLKNGSNVPYTPVQDDYYGVRIICVGDIRFSFVLNSPLNPNETATPKNITTKHVLWMDKKGSGQACNPGTITKSNFQQDIPNIPGSDNTPEGQAFRRELLGNNMRLTKFKIVDETGTGQLFKISIGIAYGDDDLFNIDNADPFNSSCRSINEGGQFCATAAYETYVKRRL